MFCSRCGSEVKSDANVCSNCGAPLYEQATTKTTEGGEQQIADVSMSEPSKQNVTDGSVNTTNTTANTMTNSTANTSNYNWSESMNNANRPNNESHPKFALWLTISIITTICCCPIPGIISIVMSVMGNNSYKIGNIEDADSKMNIAKILCIVGIVLGVISSILSFIYFYVVVGTMDMTSYY